MGFILGRLEEAVPAPIKIRRRTVEDKAPTSPDKVGCDACALKAVWGTITTPQMFLTGNVAGDVLVLGEAPTDEEDKKGEAFVGEIGEYLRRAIPARSLQRVAYQNAVRCRPPKARNPTAREMHACSTHLADDIGLMKNVKAILGVGAAPLSKFLPETFVTRAHGTRFPVSIGDKVLWYYPVLHPSFVLQNTKGRWESPFSGVFKADVRRFFKELDTWEAPQICANPVDEVLVVNTLEEAEAAFGTMDDGPVAIDLETNRLRPFHSESRILSASISDGMVTISFAIDHPEKTNPWGLAFLLKVASQRRWIAHNASFELMWMVYCAKRAGIPFEPMPFDDTMAQVRLYHQRETLTSLALASRIHLGINVKTIMQVDAAKINDYPLAKVLPYNGLDAWASARIFRKLYNKVDRTNYESLLGRIESCTAMELEGLPVSQPEARALKAEWTNKLANIEKQASKIYEVRQYEMAHQTEFNIGSNEHIGKALVEFGKVQLPKGANGNYTVDEPALKKAAPDNPLVKLVLDHREATKLVSTYVDVILDAPKEAEDQQIHPGYTCMLTATYRLSSQNPNIQNVPKRRHREIRRQVKAPDGHILVSIDYGQLEFRVYGCATRDRALCDYIISGRDLHYDWLDRALRYYPEYLDRLAEKTNQTDEKKVRKYGRDIIKSDFTFATLYGSRPPGISQNTGIPLDITTRLYNELWEEFPDAAKWNANQRKTYLETGDVVTLTGKVRHAILPGNETINTPMQSAAADVVLEAQTELYRLSKAEKNPIIMPRINVHDDLTFIVPDNNELIDNIERIANIMVRPRFDWQIVPFTAEIKVGYNWCDMEEVGVMKGDYHRYHWRR